MGALRSVIMTCAIAVTCTVPVYPQLPGDCSGADQDRNASFTRFSVEAVMRGDAQRAVSLMREMETGLSPGCRAALDRQQPARVLCTANERNLILDHYQGMIGAAFKQDIQRVFELFDGMEASVSSQCWLAVNQSTDPDILQACSADELDTMASFAGPIVRSTRSAVVSGDLSQMVQVLEDLQRRLSPSCNQGLAKAAQRNPPPAAGSPPRLPSVEDHGNGTYSVPGVGWCTPTDCAAE